MTIKEQALEIVKALNSKLGLDIKLIEISDVTVLADYMVIATGRSSTQVKALADEVEFKLSEKGVEPSHIEGHRSNSWILLDYTDIIVNVFDEEARDFYALDRLWQDGKEIDIEDIIS
ncbi:MAG: ribosome silencing factor [Ruminococcus sp.]|jgi:ribosome-associated protein|nr:ribosome silencing factor [Ruminococcus sp.]